MKRRKRKVGVETTEETEISILDIVDADTVCAVCSAEFLDVEDLKLHVMQVHLHESNGKVICKFCYSIFSCAEEYAAHLIYKHLCEIKFCFYCYRSFETINSEHESKHRAVKGNRIFTCSQCTKMFTNKEYLQKHEYDKHKDGEGIMLNAVFPLLSSALNMPIKSFMKSLSKSLPFKCTVCAYTSVKLDKYVDHLKKSNCKSYSCDRCNKVFKDWIGIFRHLYSNKRCQNFFIEKEKCPKCDKFFLVNNLAAHIETCSAVKCPVCEIVLSSMYELTDHRAKVHITSISLETCKFCKREFVGTVNLKKHIKRTHKNHHLYKYRCMHCETVFMHPSKLFAHYFTRHKDIRPYTCKICDKTFRLRKQFTFHIKLTHKSIGYVEFDPNLHVFFTDKKSEKPFKPTSENIELGTDVSDDDITESCLEQLKKPNDETKNNKTGCKTQNKTSTQKTEEKATEKSKEKSTENIDEESTAKIDELSAENTENSSEQTNLPKTLTEDNETTQDYIISDTTEKTQDSDDIIQPKLNIGLQKAEKINDENRKGLLESPSKSFRKRRARMIKNTPMKRTKRVVRSSKKSSVDSSDDEPLSNVRDTILKGPPTSLKARLRMRNKKIKLTCKFCNKYCYTVQNYYHHMSLHEGSKLKKCIKCHEQFKSKDELKYHIDKAHSSSRLTETLKSLLEKRKKSQPADVPADKPSRPADSIKSLVEQRKKKLLMAAPSVPVNKFRQTIKKVNLTDCGTATITPLTDHGLSVKNFIENFRPDIAETVSISNSVTIKTIDAPADKKPFIKIKKFEDDKVEPDYEMRSGTLSFPVKFKDDSIDMKTNVKVTLVQQLITKPKLVNLDMDERIPVMTPPPQPEYSEYCNTFADETDYTQYKNDATIPEVGQEVMLRDVVDVPRTKRLAREIVIPNIPEKYGGVRIAHLQPQAPFYKIVKVAKLLKAANKTKESESEDEAPDINIELPDGTQLVTVKNPFSHIIPNEKLEEVLKATKNKYYTPKTKNIRKALVKALKAKPPGRKPGPKRGQKKKVKRFEDDEY